MSKTSKLLGTLVLGVAFFLFFGVVTSTHAADLTVDGNLYVNGQMYEQHNWFKFAGDSYYRQSGVDPTLDFQRGDSQLKDMGDLYIITDDYTHLGPSKFDIGEVLVQNVSEMQGRLRTASGTLRAGTIKADTISPNNLDAITISSDLGISSDLTVSGTSYLDEGLVVNDGSFEVFPSGDVYVAGELMVDDLATFDNGIDVYELAEFDDIDTYGDLWIEEDAAVEGTLTIATLTDGTATLTEGVLSGASGSIAMWDSGTLSDARLSTNVTLQGNNFNGANQLVKLDASGYLPALNGSALTNLSKSQIGLGNVENTALSTWGGSVNITTIGAVTTGSWQSSAIGISYGGTGHTTKTAAFDALSPLSATGDMLYFNGTNNVKLSAGSDGDFLSLAGGVPIWAEDVDALSVITGAIAVNTIASGDYNQTWNWSLTTTDKAAFTFGENIASTATGSPAILKASTLINSTAMPLYVKNLGEGNSFRVDDQSSDTTSFIIDKNGNVVIGSDFFDPTAPEKLKVDAGATTSYNIISGYGDVNSYLQMNIKNRNAGPLASSDIVATADNGTETNYFVDMGIGSSNYDYPGYGILGANDAYLVNQGGDLNIGTGTADKDLIFFTGGAELVNERVRIDGDGNVGINTTSPGSELDVKGAIRLSGSTSGYVGLQPAAAAGSTTYTLPSADGAAGQALITNGSGVLSWASGSSVWTRVGTILSPSVSGDDVTTSGDIYTSGSGTIVSAGLLTGNTGANILGGVINLNTSSNSATNINSGTSTGAITLGNSLAGAINATSSSSITIFAGASSTWSTTSGALTVTSAAAATWGTTAGNLTLQAAGTGTSANIQIGVGGAGSVTPDLFALDVKSTTGDPASGADGSMYYNGFSDKFRCYISGAWTDCANSDLDAIAAATDANTINNGDNAQVWNWSLTTADKAAFTFGENIASTATGKAVILEAKALASSTAIPLYVNNLGEGSSFRVDDEAADVTQFLIDKSGNVGVGTNYFDPTNPEKFKVEAGTTTSYNVISGYGDLNNYLQLNIKNRNAGTLASSDVVATADNGNESSHYIDMGINSSGYSNAAYSITGPNDGYLYVVGNSGAGNLAIGTASANTVIKFHTGGTTAASEQMRIDEDGYVGINTTSPGSELDVKGTIRLSGATNGYVGLQAAAAAGSTTYTLPSADGSAGYALATNGSGSLYWANAIPPFQRVGTVISPVNAGDDITTSGDIYTSGSGVVTSAGLLTGSAGLAVSGANVNINTNSNFNTNINSGNSTGTINVGNASSGAINFASSSTINLQGSANTFTTTSGAIKFQPGDTGTTGYVYIGEGGTGSATPDLLALDVKSTTGDPAVGTDGAMYYNEFTNKFRCRINGSWSDCDTTGGTVDLQTAYNNGASIVTAGNIPIAFTLTEGNFNVTGAGAVNLTPTSASQFTSVGALTLTAGAASTWSTTSGALTITSAAAATWGTSVGDLTLQAAGSGSTANIHIGAGGAGSITPDLFALDVKSTTGDPAGGYNGAMYYNQFDGVFRCYEAGGWKNCGQSAATATTLEQAYTAGNTISTTGNNIIFTLNNTDQFTASGAGSVNLIPTGASSFTSGGALTLTAGATSTWSTSTGALTVDSAAALNLGTTNATGITLGKAGTTTINIGTLQTGNSSTTGLLKISDGSSNYINFTAPSIASDYTLTWPTDDGLNGQALITNGTGTLSWFGLMADPMTTRGDMIYRDATNATARLGVGTSDQVLHSNGTDVAWATLTNSDVGLGNVSNTAQIAQSLGIAKGDLIAYTASNTPTRLPLGGTTGWVLTVDPTQTTGMKWATNLPADGSLDFQQFKDAMTVDANTSINLAGNSYTINDLTGGGVLNLSTNAAAMTLTAGAASTWGTSTGNLNLQVAGSGTSANVQIGSGVASSTPDRLVLDQGTADPAGTNGAMYYNTANNRFRCYENSAWVDCGTNAPSTTSLQDAYTNGSSITTASSNPILFTLTSGNFNVTGANAINLTPAAASQFTSGGALTLTGGAASTWGTSTGNLSLQAAGTGATADVQIGAGGAGSATPDMLVLDIKSDSGDPTGTNGAMYYNDNTNKLRCYENGAWKNCDAGIPQATGLAKGDLIAYTASNTPTRLPLGGTTGWVLTVDPTQTTGMKWAAAPSAPVTTVFGRTGDILAVTNDYTWAQIDKTTSSLADITTRSAGDLNTGTLNDARLSSSVTKQGNTFNGADELVMLDSSSKLPAVDGSQLTGLTKVQVGLSNVENITLTTWAGSTNVATLGTIATGTWSATAIASTRGGTGITTYAAGDILYASAANTLSKLPIGSEGQVMTINSGIPSWQNATGMTNPMTNVGDIIYGGTGGTPTRLAGSAGFLKSTGFAAPTWSSVSLTNDVSGVLPIANGGTNSTATPTNGGVSYGTGTAYAFTAAGTSGQVLKSNGAAAPTWTDGGTMMLTGNSNNTKVNNTTLYYPIIGNMAGSATSSVAGTRSLMSRNGTIKNFYLLLDAPIGSGKTGSVTITKNGVATSIVITLNTTSTSYSDIVNSFTVAPGDEIGVKVTVTSNTSKFSWAADLTY